MGKMQSSLTDFLLRLAPQCIFIVSVPTPQRTPVFNQLALDSDGIFVIYLTRQSSSHGWGTLDIRHPHYFTNSSWQDVLSLWVYLLRAKNVRVVAPFGYRGVMAAASLIAARFRRLTVVTRSDSNLCSLESERPSKKMFRKVVYRLLFPSGTRIWAIGERNSQYWRAYLGYKNIYVIPYSTPELPGRNELPPPRRLSNPAQMRFLYVGRLVEIKGVEDAIRAFMATKEDYPLWSFDIVGEGSHRERLESLSSSDDRIRFVGSIEYQYLDRYYSVADVLVLVSHLEPWGLVVNEAIGFGCYIIVTDVAGSSELVSDDSVGVVIPAGDSLAIYSAMLRSVDFLERVPIRPFNPAEKMLQELRSFGVY